jgi:hypothetical protein
MAIALTGSALHNAGYSLTNLTVLRPTGLSVNDVIVALWFVFPNGGTLALPSGWVEFLRYDNVDVAVNGDSFVIAYKAVTPEDLSASTYDFVCTVATGQSVTLIPLTGINKNEPLASSTGTGYSSSTNTFVAPSATADFDNSWVLYAWCRGDNIPAPPDLPSGVNALRLTSGPSVFCAYKTLPVSGAAPTASITYETASIGFAHSVIINRSLEENGGIGVGSAVITKGKFYEVLGTGTLIGYTDVVISREHLFPQEIPSRLESFDTPGVAYEMGTVFTASEDGWIFTIRFWKTPTDTGTYVGHIWDTDITVTPITLVEYHAELGTASFGTIAAGVSGWVEAPLALPLYILKDHQYVVTVNLGTKYYPITIAGLSSPVIHEHLTALYGLYTGATGTYPTSLPQANNFFRDVGYLEWRKVPAFGLGTLTPIGSAVVRHGKSYQIGGGQAKLRWDVSEDLLTGGYYIYWGTTSQTLLTNYPFKSDVGNTDTITLGGLTPNITYYFRVNGYDAYHRPETESIASNETSTIPIPIGVAVLVGFSEYTASTLVKISGEGQAQPATGDGLTSVLVPGYDPINGALDIIAVRT